MSYIREERKERGNWGWTMFVQYNERGEAGRRRMERSDEKIEGKVAREDNQQVEGNRRKRGKGSERGESRGEEDGGFSMRGTGE